jgi:hypothetical protein
MEAIITKNGEIEIRGAHIARRNFRGEERRFGGKIMNSAGNRNFLLILPDDMVGDLIADGWNVKQFKPAEDGTPGDYFVQVKVGFNYKPPTCWLVTDKGDSKVRTKLDEDSIGELDFADIVDLKLLVKPVRRVDEYNGQERVTAYLKTLYAEVESGDPFADDEEWM